MGYSFTDLGAEGCRPSLNALFGCVSKLLSISKIECWHLCIMLLKNATRKGDGQAVIMAKRKLAPLFYGCNHLKYQKICVHNLIVECLMPNTVKAIVMDSLSLSRTGQSGHYQGGDACLEEINKAAKSWIPCTGVPFDKYWLKVFHKPGKVRQGELLFCKILALLF